jgi:hypothetical protein
MVMRIPSTGTMNTGYYHRNRAEPYMTTILWVGLLIVVLTILNYLAFGGVARLPWVARLLGDKDDNDGPGAAPKDGPP